MIFLSFKLRVSKQLRERNNLGNKEASRQQTKSTHVANTNKTTTKTMRTCLRTDQAPTNHPGERDSTVTVPWKNDPKPPALDVIFLKKKTPSAFHPPLARLPSLGPGDPPLTDLPRPRSRASAQVPKIRTTPKRTQQATCYSPNPKK